MSITSAYVHTLEHDFEQYSFVSNVNPKQRHFIDTDDQGVWKLGIVQLEESLTLDELQELRIELADLCAFMAGLKRRELHRHTEPGEPDLAGRGGGL